MSKGLDIIEDLKRGWFINEEMREEYGINALEKELKALEIIKKKKVDVKLLLDNNDDRIRPEYRFFDYNCTRKYEEKLDQEEFDLLIEVLENGN